MATILKSYVRGGAGQVHVRQSQPGPSGDGGSTLPVLCLHQIPKSSLEYEDFMRAAGARRRLIAFDFPGCGMSDRPHSEETVTIEYYAATVIDVMDRLEIQCVEVIGNHTGAMVAVRLADAYPARVRAAALISAPVMTEAEQRAFADYFAPVPLDCEGTRFRQSWSRVVSHAGPRQTLEHLARSYMQNVMAGDAYEWGHAAAFAWAPQFAEALARLAQPVLVVNPADDLFEQTRRAKALLRNGAYVERPDWAHGLLDTDAAEFSSLVLDFFERAGAPR